jgi:hypothetical protein
VTLSEVEFTYDTAPSESEARALDDVRVVYGIRNLIVREKSRCIAVEYDASRLKESEVCALLRAAGVQIRETAILVDR